MKKHYWKDDCMECEISDLIGRVFHDVRTQNDDERLVLACSDGMFVFEHDQDCCESVSIESIAGDLSDLIGSPIVRAEESTSEETPEGYTHEWEPESQTWTFYKLATIKGYVDIRWLGESNGYYSESVQLLFYPINTTN